VELGILLWGLEQEIQAQNNFCHHHSRGIKPVGSDGFQMWKCITQDDVISFGFQPIGMPAFDVGVTNCVRIQAIGNDELVLASNATAWW
jgi:hypothetical protein